MSMPVETAGQIALALPGVATTVPVAAVFYLKLLPFAFGDPPAAWRYVTPNVIMAVFSAAAAGVMYSQPFVSPSPSETGLWICWVGFQFLVVYFSTGLMPEVRRWKVEAAARDSEFVETDSNRS